MALAVAAVVAQSGHAQTLEELRRLSLEELGHVEITSVSKKPEPLSDAAASVYVISHDDIVRSGALSIPEILRLAPNLEVFETSPSSYVVTARGFSGNANDQNFSDKLLVLIDGRSVYSPLYSGVYWDAQDVLPENIERIEVISGPGATLWGANAVNGVINITTRSSGETQGGVLELGIGNVERKASLQYAGRLGEDLTYRVYAEGFSRSAFDSLAGSNAHDGWEKPQGGFRIDWTPPGDVVTLEGDLYAGAENLPDSPNQDIAGRSLTARWHRDLGGGSALELQAYYDWTRRSSGNDGGAFVLDTYDISLQHSFALTDWNSVVWGAGERVNWYRITDRLSPVTSLLFVPPGRTLSLANIFAEDHLSLGERVKLTLGLKLENDPYSGLSPMPTGRILWKPLDSLSLWAAISRAVRSPTPFDRDVAEKLGSLTYLVGGPDFVPEEVTAYEAGLRGQVGTRASYSVTAFDDVYDDLKSIEPAPATFIPLSWGNKMKGEVYGLEAWGSFRVQDWWTLSAGATLQHENFGFAAGASGLLGIAQAGDDPHHWASLRSSMNVLPGLTVDADLRYVGALPDPKVPDYAELNLRLGWAMTDRLSVSLSGFNLLHSEHREFSGPSDEVKRSVFFDTRWKF